MLVKYLTYEDKGHLLELAELLSISDNPLLWDGKEKDAITSETDLSELTIQDVERETALIAELRAEGATHRRVRNPQCIEEKLIKKIKALPLQTADDPENRALAAKTVMIELIEDQKFETPSVPKMMLFELMSMALCDGSISSIEWVLLREFQRHHQLEDFIFDDILERAQTVNREISKTIAIILE